VPAVDVTFGRFQVSPLRRELLADGQPIKLGGRTFDVLVTLIEAHGAVVTKDELMERVWPGLIVEDNNVQGHVSALRAAFGADRDLIRTVSGRGYQFTGEIRPVTALPDEVNTKGQAAAQPEPSLPPTNLPEQVSELIGRDDKLREILDFAPTHRLITLTGAGGVGKTRLALAVARQLLPQFVDGVWLADFSAVSDPASVFAKVACAVGIQPPAGDISAQLVAKMLTGRRMLLVLDTCEHVIGAVAALTEAVLRSGSGLCIIATSREPLKSEGEQVYPVPPLAIPTKDVACDDDLMQQSAVRLFVERTWAAQPHFAPDRRAMETIATICRRLDGVPLAIELAAARAAALGVEELAARLDAPFSLLTVGRRTASPRHQSLRATLDWSYELLDEPERMLLHRLAVFTGAFSLEAACAAAGNTETTRPDVAECFFNLLAKSLIAMELDGDPACYRLLETTRAYALDKLANSGALDRLTHVHGECHRDRATVDGFSDNEPQIGAARAAEWAPAPSFGCQSRSRRRLRPTRDPHAAYAVPAAPRHARSTGWRAAQ
jgi:predicted ATPase/DNA-binding winged helix-turn-helix (wHTH) protein